MRCRIAGLVDGLNSLFHDADPEMFRSDQHIQFKFVGIGRQAEKIGQQFAGNAAQAGLAVLETLADDRASQGARTEVAEATAKRDALVELAVTEDQTIRILFERARYP